MPRRTVPASRLRLVPAALLLLALGLWLPLGAQPMHAQDASASDPAAGEAAGEPAGNVPRVLRDWLVIAAAGGGRSTVPVDAILPQYIVGRAPREPVAGETAHVGNGVERVWQAATADESTGVLRHDTLRNGWATATFEAARDGAAIAEVRAAYWLHINGVSHPGDVYNRGRTAVPIRVRAGTNRMWLRGVRGQVQVTLRDAPAAPFFELRDNTLPDLRDGEPYEGVGAVLVTNPTGELLVGATLEAGDDEVFAVRRLALPPVLPYAQIKAAVPIRLIDPLARAAVADHRVELPLRLRLADAAEPTAEATVSLQVRGPREAYKVTFRSEIDGSVQYYAVRPPAAWEPRRRYALVLSCHGASVEAIGQARAYSNQRDAFVVAPTNRRPFGFDWEDWGRLDALEVLAHAQATLPVDLRRVYLTGHSMGGHGTWHLGVTYPDRFAAIGPSAGWASLFTYGNLPRGEGAAPPEAYFVRGLLPSDTERMLENLRHTAVYVLHGEADDNVPVREARRLVEQLREFHENVRYHEQPGAGHWWNGPASAGADCVDWPPMFEQFDRSRLPLAPRELDFRTSNLAVSATHFWVTLLGQPRPFAMSRIRATLREGSTPAVLRLTLENLDRLRLDLDAHFPGRDEHPLRVELDGHDQPLEITWRRGVPLYLGRQPLIEMGTSDGDGTSTSGDDGGGGGTWWIGETPRWDAGERHPQRYGLFKDAFRHRFLFVYGTHGDEAMNAAMLEKARYDASTWWYYANGAVEVLPDYLFDPRQAAGRNVILFGNADANRAFEQVLGPLPMLHLTSEALRVPGSGLAQHEPLNGSVSVLAIRPKAGCDTTAVGIVGGTDAEAMARLLNVRYFRSGLAQPDITALVPGDGPGSATVAAAGFFGRDWSHNPAAGAELWVSAD